MMNTHFWGSHTLAFDWILLLQHKTCIRSSYKWNPLLTKASICHKFGFLHARLRRKPFHFFLIFHFILSYEPSLHIIQPTPPLTSNLDYPFHKIWKEASLEKCVHFSKCERPFLTHTHRQNQIELHEITESYLSFFSLIL